MAKSFTKNIIWHFFAYWSKMIFLIGPQLSEFNLSTWPLDDRSLLECIWYKCQIHNIIPTTTLRLTHISIDVAWDCMLCGFNFNTCLRDILKQSIHQLNTHLPRDSAATRTQPWTNWWTKIQEISYIAMHCPALGHCPRNIAQMYAVTGLGT